MTNGKRGLSVGKARQHNQVRARLSQSFYFSRQTNQIRDDNRKQIEKIGLIWGLRVPRASPWSCHGAERWPAAPSAHFSASPHEHFFARQKSPNPSPDPVSVCTHFAHSGSRW